MSQYKSETVAQQTPAQPKFAPSDILGAFAIIADVLVTIFIVVGMAQDKHSVTVSVLSGVAFFFLFGVFVIAMLSGTLTAIITNNQNQKTVRLRDALPYKYAQEALPSVHLVDHARLGYSQPVDPVQLPTVPSFVPAIPRTPAIVKAEAASFISQLFDSDGRPLPSKITKNKGQIQHQSPTPEAVEYLMALDIVKRGEGRQLYYNRDEYQGYPTLREAINAIRTGVRKASSQEHEEGRGGEGVGSESPHLGEKLTT